jgi:hypothetical protein
MKRLITFILLIVLSIGLVGINVYNQIVIKKIKNERLINSSHIDKKMLYDEVKDKVFKDQYFYAESININLILFDSSIFKDIKISEIASVNPLFVFRFSFNDCDPCINKILEQLKDLGAIIGFEKIVIILDFDYPRQIGVFVREHNLKFRVYSLTKFEFGTELDKHTPYFFILDNEFFMKNLFFAFHSYEGLNLEYFELIRDKYFSVY